MRYCEYCDREFTYNGPRGKNYPAKTCSLECSRLLRSKKLSQLNVDRRIHEKVEKVCEVCDVKISTTDSKNQKITCSRKCLGRLLSERYAGRKLTEEWKLKQNLSKTRDKIVKHGEFSCNKCDKKFTTNTSLRAHRSYCTPGNNGQVVCEICGKKLSPRGYKIHKKSHDEEWRNKNNETLRKALKRRSAPQTTSKSELDFFEKLKRSYKGEVIHKFKINEVTHEYDFYIPSINLIIEFDGDYWHGNKKLHELTTRMKQQHRIDEAWSAKAINAGYNIIRVWASESNEFKLEQYANTAEDKIDQTL